MLLHRLLLQIVRAFIKGETLLVVTAPAQSRMVEGRG